MDRRDALKKLGMGGAAVVGATMVMSSPAFGATIPVSPIPAASTNVDENVATFSYTLVNPQCTGGSDPNGLAEALSDSLTANNGSVMGLVLTATGGGNPKFKQNDTATLTVTTRSTCTYSNATETPVDQTFEFNFAWSPPAKNYLLVTA